MREMIAQAELPHASSPVSQYITISQGVVSVTPGGEHEPADLIKLVDRALYAAKDAGRDAISME
jgi:PleD family two-component response regulator